jgi:hypothetical protein
VENVGEETEQRCIVTGKCGYTYQRKRNKQKMNKKERKELLKNINKTREALNMSKLERVPNWMIYKEKK